MGPLRHALSALTPACARAGPWLSGTNRLLFSSTHLLTLSWAPTRAGSRCGTAHSILQCSGCPPRGTWGTHATPHIHLDHMTNVQQVNVLIRRPLQPAPPPDFHIIGHTKSAPYAAIAHNTKPLYGIQFHPEVTHEAIGDSYVLLGLSLGGTCASFSQTTLIRFHAIMVDTSLGISGKGGRQ